MTLRTFLLGDESAAALVGWHIAVFIAFAAGWCLARLRRPRDPRCLRYGCERRLPPLLGPR